MGTNLAVSAIIMIGRSGESEAEKLVHRAVQASALDLIDLLFDGGTTPIIVAGPDLSWVPADLPVVRDSDHVPFHFGQRLAGLIEAYDLSPVMYFGAGSAPLMTADMLGLLQGMLYQSEFGASTKIPAHITLTNNMHSSDWLGISHARDAVGIVREAQRDNSLAWMLQENWDYDVRVLSGMRPSTSMDIDTPADVAIVGRHDACSARLADVSRDPLLAGVPVDAVLDVVARDGSRLALIGRVSPLAWQAVSKATQCWIRVFSEERGMVASERLLRGEVRSLVGTMVDLLGPAAFFDHLATLVDAAIIDTRVLMAVRGGMPSASDRFASDLYRPEAITDPWLRDFTQAASAASIPVLLGGHGVVSGGLYALADIISARRRGR